MARRRKPEQPPALPTPVVTARDAFSSMDEFIAAALTNAKSDEPGNKEFHGTENLQQAVKRAREGWPKGRDRIVALRAELEFLVEKNAQARVRQLVWGNVGEYVDVGRMLSGEPEYFGTYSDDGHGQPAAIHRLVANVAVSCSVSQETIFARGAAMYAAVDVLEALGHRVELHVGIAGKYGCGDRYGNSSGFQSLTVLVKEASQPVEADRLAFALCHASMLRRLGFAVMRAHGLDLGLHWPADAIYEDGEVVSFPSKLMAGDCSLDQRVLEVERVCDALGVALPASQVEGVVC